MKKIKICKLAKFTIDDSTEVEAYDLTPTMGKWNGWDSPGFTFEQANKMIGKAPHEWDECRCDKEKDAFVMRAPEWEEAEIYHAELITTDIGKVKIYAIGA